MIPAESRGVWRDLETRLRPYVGRRVASAAEVDDIVQEILIRVHKGVATLREDERFGGWVYRIAARAIADFGRARSRDPLAPAAVVADAPHDDAAEAADLQLELGECVALFVAQLPSPYREAITLTELQGLTQKEAAAMLGTSLPGMKSRIQRGREKIRAMFEACCEVSVDCRGRIVDCEPREPEKVPSDCREAAAAWAARHPPR
jgi:RNA polymerase sigma-70 factor (ECF subfamily)